MATPVVEHVAAAMAAVAKAAERMVDVRVAW